jgi:hypothetical protein
MRLRRVRGCWKWRLGSSAEDALESKIGFRTRTLYRSRLVWLLRGIEGSSTGRLLCRLWPLSESTGISQGRGDFHRAGAGRNWLNQRARSAYVLSRIRLAGCCNNSSR